MRMFPLEQPIQKSFMPNFWGQFIICNVSPFLLDFCRQIKQSNYVQKYTF